MYLLLLFLILYSPVIATTQVPAPSLKWQRGGCYSSWCETGWYSSPAVADLDNDGKMEVIGAAYSLFVLDGETGSLNWSVDPNGSRVWPGVVVCDIDSDGDLEIVTAHGSGYLNVFTHTGSTVWSRRPITRELRGLSVADLDNDGTMEIVVNGAVGSRTNTWVYEHNGTLRGGWPQLDNDAGSAYGVFNDNASIADIDGDGSLEIVVPSDVCSLCVYRPNGVQLAAHSMYGGKTWGEVSVWESLTTELRGWGSCSGVRSERYRTNFAHGASVVADMDGDGSLEVVVTGNVYDCAAGHPPGKYNGVFIFNNDRSRFNITGADWQTAPVNTGAPLTESYDVIENNQPNPVVVDLEGDGVKEIIYSSYDGRVHAFWLDKTEHHNWPYSVYQPSEGYFRFASEPVVADLDNDGYAEVIFTSWVQKSSYLTGKLHILNHLGTVLREISLPAAFGSSSWNGALSAPTLADIDSDADLEVIVNTAHSGIVAYDLPGSANARILWGTGRGNYLRNGFAGNTSSNVTPDFNRDGQADILWRNISTGQNVVWYMRNTIRLSYKDISKVSDTDWEIVANGDFNEDGKVDILWRHRSDGRNIIWYMNNTKRTSHAFILSVADIDWEIAATADFNGDNHLDILWRHRGDGRNLIWYMNNATLLGTAYIGRVRDMSWRVAGTGDFNGDGKVDILWRNYSDGKNCVWYLDNATTMASKPAISWLAAA